MSVLFVVQSIGFNKSSLEEGVVVWLESTNQQLVVAKTTQASAILDTRGINQSNDVLAAPS